MAPSRMEQSVARFRESERLAEAGNAARAVEVLHVAAELAIDELAERNSVAARRPQMSPHEARARASVELRGLGLVPAGFDNVLRRLNDDRKRTKYDGKPTRYDRLTLAQAQASVKLVIDALGPEVWANGAAAPTTAAATPAAPELAAPARTEVVLPAGVEPPPAERAPAGRRPRWPLFAAVAAAVAVVAVVAALASGGDGGKPTPRQPAARPVRNGATGRLGPASFRIDHVYTGSRLALGQGVKARGIFAVAYLQVGNRTDVLQPLHLSAFRLRTRGGIVAPYGRTAQTSVVLQPAQATAVELPFDVPPARLRGAQLLVDTVSRSGKRIGPGLAMALPLDDGIGAIAAGTWRGSTSQGRPFTMRVDRGSVIRRISFDVRTSSGRTCPVRFRGVYFIDATRFALRGRVVAAGRFSSSTEADGAVVAPPGGRCSFANLRWTATTPLK